MTDAKTIQQRVLSGKSWEDFCDALKEAGKIVLRPDADSTDIDRAEGFRYLSRLARLGLESKLEFADTDFPGFYSLSHETAKIGADNPDNLYANATLDANTDYKITGTRGTVFYISWGTKANRYTIDGTMASTGEIDTKNLVVNQDGTFEINLSQKPKNLNWLKMAPDTSALVVRQTFFDRATEKPAILKIERVGEPKQLQPLSAQALDRGLSEAAAFVKGTALNFAVWGANFRNTALNDWNLDQEMCIRAGGDPNIYYMHGYWKCAPDEALIVDSQVPECELWNFQLNNFWMESLDYRHLPIWINKHKAKLNKDGSVTIVVAAKNPGVDNWLDTAGHVGGVMLWRWIRAKSFPVPKCRLVKLASLEGSGLKRAS